MQLIHHLRHVHGDDNDEHHVNMHRMHVMRCGNECAFGMATMHKIDTKNERDE